MIYFFGIKNKIILRNNKINYILKLGTANRLDDREKEIAYELKD